MSIILASVSTENIERAKLLLNVAFVVATIGVWAGVWLEGKKFSEGIQEIGWKLLVACLGIEAIFGVAMLQLDSEITGRQKIEVATLTKQSSDSERLAQEARERAANAELALQNFRALRTLSPKQQERVTEQMKPFAGVKFDGAWASIDAELDLLFTSIEDALKNAGLASVSFNGPGFIFGRDTKSSVGMANVFGVIINVDQTKNPELMPAALALVIALTKEGVGAGFQPKVGFVSTNADTIHILIGAKH